LETADILRVVSDDLAYLHGTWDQTIQENSLRVTSPILRRLIVEGVLQRGWKAAGFEKEPRITAFSLAREMSYVERTSRVIALAWAGGAKVQGGVQMSNFMSFADYVSDKDATALSAMGVSEETLGLRAFTEAPSIIVRGEAIPRRVVIKYIVNTQGGAHVGMDKRVSENERRQYRRLDEAKNSQGGQYPVPYFELLSIGQALVRSEDITRLREKIQAMRLSR
jgi:hypothetical protein